MLTKFYQVTCDSCGETTEIMTKNPRYQLVGWRNGQRVTPLNDTTKPSQYMLDICPDCIAEGYYITRDGSVINHDPTRESKHTDE